MHHFWKKARMRHTGEHGGHKHRRMGWRRPKYNVPTNIIENDRNFEVWVYALDFERDNIKVAVTDDTLYITGTRTLTDGYDPNFVLQEYPIKSFERSFELNQKVDATAIKAKHENGILKVTLPKSKEALQPEIDIEIV